MDGNPHEEIQEGRCWIYSCSKRTGRSAMRSWREELSTGSNGAIINWTCVRAEHTRR